MIAVDIGNTFTRIVAFDESSIKRRISMHTRDLQLHEATDAFVQAAESADDKNVWIASVAPQANALVDAAAERAGLVRRFIRPANDFIIPHSLATPQTTGVDRLLSALSAGLRHFPRNGDGKGYVVVQCGSAATVDLVDENGIFLGGYILPGPTFWLLGLSAGAQLPDLSSELPDWSAVAPGDNTRDAIVHGMQATLPAAVAAAVLQLNAGKNRPAVITGGWGDAVLPFMPPECVLDPELLLHGIRLYAAANSR